jgi:uroporphyrinogen III methyltransferase / synthase
MKVRGKVSLIGAGPGDPGLLTLRAVALIRCADVVVYDYLCNPEILGHARPDAKKIYAGKTAGQHTLTQDQINQLLIDHAVRGRAVARLKGGDPFLFGRGGEEAEALLHAGINFEVVPGVTSAIAVPAYAGIPVTHRDFTSTFTVVTGHEDPEKESSAIDWPALARNQGTRVFLMGVERIGAISERLIREGADPATPVALVRWGTTGRQETVEGTLSTIAPIVAKREFKAPAVTIIGGVVSLRRHLNWFEQKTLFGRRIVVTRTRTQAGMLTERLRDLGADVLEIPTIRIKPSSLPARARQQFKQMERHFDWLVFASPNAVDCFFHEFFKINDDIRALGKVRIAAVGPATAAKLTEHHLKIDRQPRQYTTVALAKAFKTKEIKDHSFCLPRGNLADTALSNYLKKQGGRVTEWTIYRTIPETGDLNGARARYQVEGADWITFTSSSTVENWHALKLKVDPKGRPPRHASIGPVTSATLKKLGYRIDCEAKKYTIDGLVSALLQSK